MKKRKFIALLFVLGFGSFPIYLLPSGLPQLTHLLFLIFALCCLFWLPPAKENLGNIYRLLGALCIVIYIRQCFFAIDEGITPLIPFIYVFYNALIFTGTYRYFNNSTSEALHPGALLSIAICLFGVLLYGASFVVVEGTPYRTVGTFNNPNQLGYYSLCLSGIAAIGYLRGFLPFISSVFILIGCTFLTIMSLSKAAIVAILFYGLIYFRWREAPKVIPAIVAIAVIVGAIIGSTGTHTMNLKFVHRLQGIGSQSDDTLEARGYGPLLDPDIRIIYGYGEGYVKSIIGHETHSTIGNILISYGFLGFLLFASLLFLVFLRLVKQFGFVVAVGLMTPVVVYGITHNGFRFTIFWIYLAIASAQGPAALFGSEMRYNHQTKSSFPSFNFGLRSPMLKDLQRKEARDGAPTS